MNSFYEVPRSAPKPTSVGSIPSMPLVPEVSMIFGSPSDSNNTTANDSVYLSYKAWKERSQNKTVAFQDQKDSIPLGIQKQTKFDITKQPLKATTSNLGPVQKTMQPFEQIYMANIPNRHLDLSIIEPPKVISQREIENVSPNVQLGTQSPIKQNSKQVNAAYDYETWRSKRDALDKHLTNESIRSGVTDKNRIIDLYNYKQTVETPFPNNVSHIEKKCKCKDSECNSSTQTEDVTVKDLLKIIQQQNEQLLILQKQVATLIHNKDTPKDTRANAIMFEDQCPTSTQVENPYNKPSQFLPKKGPLHQISLDVMTSFELSIRRPTNPKMYGDLHHQPKICEVTEIESNDTSTENILDGISKPKDITLSLNEPQLKVPERCPTPVNSIKIDMKDYSSDSDSSNDEEEQPEWTFYNNIMTQVNHILKKSGVRPTTTAPSSARPEDVIRQNMMRKVKETTIKHLKSIGVHVPVDHIDDFHSGKNEPIPNGNEISFAVKQLLMKYLPSEHLAKLTGNKTDLQKPKHLGKITRRPEFSMATVQYMQKYNLLNDNSNHGATPAFERENFDRILDTTAIRQQPKLL